MKKAKKRLCALLLALAMLVTLPLPTVGAYETAQAKEQQDTPDEQTAEALPEPPEYEQAAEIVSEPPERERTAEAVSEPPEKTESVSAREEDAVLMANGTCGDGVNWELDNNGAMVISGEGAMYDYGASNPSPWNASKANIITLEVKKGVTSVGSSAFSGCSKLVSAVIDSNSIGGNSFNNCSALTTVTLSKSVRTIGSYAFNGCTSLRDVFYGGVLYSDSYWESSWNQINIGRSNGGLDSAVIHYNGATAVASGVCGNQIFWVVDNKGLLSVTGSGEMKDFDDNVAPWYENRGDILSIVVQEGIVSLAEGAFDGCSKMRTVHLPKSLTKIGDYVFNDCAYFNSYKVGFSSGEEYYTFDDSGVIYFGGTLEQWKKVSIGAEGNADMFYARVEFSNVTDGVIAIGKCGENISWQLTSDGLLTLSGTGVGATGRRTWNSYSSSDYYPTQSMGSQITKVVIQSGITDIAERLFLNCGNMTEIEIPSTVTSINVGAFYGCKKLESVVIPEGVESIGDNAFGNCSALMSVTMPASLKTIGDRIFYNCPALKQVDIASANPAFVSEDGVLFSKDRATLIAYYAGTDRSAYQIPDKVTAIDNYAFAYCQLPTVTIPDGVTSIGEYAFSNSQIETLKLPSGLLTIGEGAFYQASKLVAIEIPEGVTQLEPYTFYKCSSLSSVSLPSTLTTFSVSSNSYSSSYCFYSCSSLEDIIIPDGIPRMPASLFYACSKLSRVVIPKSVTYIGENSFASCAIKDVYYGGTAEDWEKISFYYNSQSWFTNATFHYDDGSSGHTSYYLITFNANGGYVSSGSKIAKINEAYGALPVPSRSNYSFDGWFTAEEGGSQITAESIMTRAENHTLYARWKAIPVSGIRLDKSGLILQPGASDTVSAIISPEDASDKTVTWRSGNPEVATVSNGVVTAVAPGSAKIEAVTRDGEFTAICLVTVQDVVINVTGISLNRHQIPSLAVGNSIALTATIAPDYVTNRSITWTTSAYDVALVSVSGVVTAVGEGTAVITATSADGGFQDSCSVTVPASREPDRIRVDVPNNIQLVQGGLLSVPGMKVYARYGSEEELITNYTISGFQTNQTGRQTITVSFRGKNASFNITVIERKATRLTLLQSPAKLEYAVGESLDLSGLAVRAEYNDKSASGITDSSIFQTSGFDSSSVGSRTVTLSYDGQSLTFPVIIRELSETEAVQPPKLSLSGAFGGKRAELTAQSGSEIYYTLDGNAPTSKSTPYTEPFIISTNAVIKAIAVSGETVSAVVSRTISVGQTEAPEAGYPDESELPAGTLVTLDSSTPGAVIYYTMDGSEPTVSGIRYGSGVLINGETTIRAVAMSEGNQNSDLISVHYTVPRAEASVQSNAVISMGSVTSRAGETVSAPVYIFPDDGEAVTDFRFSIKFNADHFAYASLTPIEDMSPATLMVSADNQDGILTVMYSGDAIAGGEMFSLNLAALDSAEDGEYSLEVASDAVTVKTDAGTPLVSAIPGVITLTGSNNSQLSGELAFKNSGTGDDVTTLPANTDGLSASVALDAVPTLENGAAIVDVFLAVYDREGMMVSLDTWNVALSNMDSVFLHGIRIPPNVEVGEIKIMILSENLTPIMAAGSLVSSL